MGSVGISVRHSDLLHFKKIQFDTDGPNQLVHGVCFDVACRFQSERAPGCHPDLCFAAEFAGSRCRFLHLHENISG